MANNNLQTQLTISAGVEGINDVRRLADTIEQAGGNVDGLRTSATNLERAWDGLSTSEQTRQLNNLADEAERLRQITSARMTLGLDVDDRARAELAQVREAYNQLRQSGTLTNSEMARATQLYNQRVQELNTQLGKTPMQLSSITQGIGGLMATLGVGVGLSEIVQLTDEFNNLEARVRLATESGGDFNHAMASIRDIADSTTMPLTATADLFGKLTQSTKELGYSQEEVLGLTKTINQAMAVSGGSAQSMEAALTQLAQGLSAGALRGDEFNSVVEQSPRLAQAMADGLGVSIGKLREMAGEGKLTAEVVGNALKSQADTIAYEYSQMPNTVSGSLTVLKNSLMGFIGELDNELSGSNSLATFITEIANNIKNIDSSVIDGLKNSLESVGVVAKVLLDSISAIPSHWGDVLGAMMGLETGAGQISLLQGLMNGLALTTGAVADGFKALQIVIYGTIAGTQTAIAELATSMHKLTGFGGEFAKTMSANAKQAQAEFEKQVMGFESSLGKAMDDIGKTTEQKLQEVADTARQKYEQMAQDGTASTTALEAAFKDYAHKAIQANGGVVDEVLKQELAQKNLQAVVDNTGKVTITAMNAIKGAVDGMDLSKHEQSFKALGIDMSEFAGGLSSKANTALTAFNDLAGVAGTNANQLAMAYNGAKQAIGNNAQGLAELDKALLQATYGSTELANGIKVLALEQQNAKNTTDAQNKALSDLGINMSAINAGMSDTGQKMAQSLAVGITAIKDTATSATALKTALQQAFDSSLNSAKTVGDFQAIKSAIEQAGVSAQLSAEQQKILNAGLQGGAEVVKALKTTTEQATTATSQNTQATQQNTQAKESNAKAGQDIAKSNEQIAQSAQKASSDIKGVAGNIGSMIDGALSPLQTLGASIGEVEQAVQKLVKTHINATYGWDAYFSRINQLAQSTRTQVEAFHAVKEEAQKMTSVLGKADVTTQDLAYAQSVLAKATSASVAGIIRMDKQTLDNLKAQIDQTKKKLDDLADSARQTADNLEGELARMQGNDAKAQELENAQKLADLQKRLDEAKQRGNTGEINQLERALNLQRQINTERLKEVKGGGSRGTSSGGLGNGGGLGGRSFNPMNPISPVRPDDVVQAFDERTRQQILDEGGQLFAQQLMQEAKRRAR